MKKQIEVDRDKLIDILVAVCPQRGLIGDETDMCKSVYLRQCRVYLGDRYEKCPPDCPHLEEAAADARCKRGYCPRIKKLLKELKE